MQNRTVKITQRSLPVITYCNCYTFTLLSPFEAHELMSTPMSSCGTRSLFRVMQRRSSSLLGVSLDRNLEQTLFIAEKQRSTVAVLVAIVVFKLISFIRLVYLFSLIGSPSRKSSLALNNSNLSMDLLMFKQSKCSTR